VAKRKISSQWLRIREGTTRSDVRIDDAVHLDPLVAQRANPALEALKRAILAAHPGGQLPEIILEIDSTTPHGRSSSAIGGTVEKTIKVHRARTSTRHKRRTPRHAGWTKVQ